MDHHEVLCDNDSHLGHTTRYAMHRQDTKGISDEKRSIDIPYSSFLTCGAKNISQSSGDDVPPYHNFKTERRTKKRTRIELAKENPNSTQKRERKSCGNHEDCEPFPLYNTNNLFYRTLLNQEHHAPFTSLSSSQEHKTTMITSSEASATSLCSASASSFSNHQHNDVIHSQNNQHSYSTSCNNAKDNMERFLIEAIRDRFRTMMKHTRLCPNTDGIRTLRSRDVVPAHPFVLGVGTFSQVTRVVLRGSDDISWNKNNQRYACKQLKQELFSKPRDFVKAATELAYEAFVLSCLDHPNIIKLRGLAEDGIASFGNGVNDTKESYRAASSCVRTPPATSFFLIMDVLQETLDQRIERWNTIARPQSLFETYQRTIEKISLCQQLASVLEYIHSKGVVYRDLKPQNIGFCEQEGGILKLFDFGLSQELPQSIAGAVSATTAVRGTGETNNPNQHVRFNLSGMVGTIRYMAPEVCLSQPYNRDCDIYSWSIVAWEIWSQTKPFETFTPDLYTALVCKQGFRPTDDDAVNAIIPHDFEALLKEAWKSEPHLRMRLSRIQCRLGVLQKLEELRLQESIREEATASIAGMTAIDDITNISLFHSPVRRLRGVMDAPACSPYINMNRIGSAISYSDPSSIGNNLGFGEFPRGTVGPIHRHNSSGIQMPSPPSRRSPGRPPSNLDPVMWVDAFDPHKYLVGNI